jgi:hypothetical protein
MENSKKNKYNDNDELVRQKSHRLGINTRNDKISKIKNIRKILQNNNELITDKLTNENLDKLLSDCMSKYKSFLILELQKLCNELNLDYDALLTKFNKKPHPMHKYLLKEKRLLEQRKRKKLVDLQLKINESKSSAPNNNKMKKSVKDNILTSYLKQLKEQNHPLFNKIRTHNYKQVNRDLQNSFTRRLIGNGFINRTFPNNSKEEHETLIKNYWGECKTIIQQNPSHFEGGKHTKYIILQSGGKRLIRYGKHGGKYYIKNNYKHYIK